MPAADPPPVGSSLRQRDRMAEDGSKTTSAPALRLSVRLTFALALLVLLLGGAWFYKSERRRLEAVAETELEAISKLKIERIVWWRAERLGDASVITDNAPLAAGLARLLAGSEPAAADEILRFFRAEGRAYGHGDVLFADTTGKVRLSLSGTAPSLHKEAVRTIDEAIRTRQPKLSDIHTGPGNLPAHIDLVAPICVGDGAARRAIGAVILRVNAQAFLFPLIQSWPVPSRSAETLLVQREGGTALFLNELRHQKDTALKLRIPLSREDVPAVMAVRGQEGIVRGRDYRGVDVLGYVGRVPGSPWFIVAKVDASEALAPWRFRAALIVGLGVGLAVWLATLLVALSQRQRAARLGVLVEARQQAERGLRRNDALMRAILDNLPIGVAVNSVDPTVTFQYMNDNFTKFYRTSRERLEDPDAFWEAVYEDSQVREATRRRVLADCASGDPDKMHWEDLPISRSGQETTYLSARNIPIPDEPLMISTVWDVTERRRSEEALRVSEDKFKYVFEYSQLGKSITLPSGEISVNAAFCKMLGYSAEELRQRTWQEITHPDDIATTQESLDAILAGKTDSARLVKRYVHKNGSIVWGDIATSLRRDQAGRPLYFMTSVSDITDRKRAEQEIQRLSEELEQRVRDRTAQLEVANQELEAFTYSVSHDLRAPLRGIDGWSLALLQDYGDQLGERARQYLDRVRSEAQRMGHLIDDLLALSRVSRAELVRRPVDISALAQTIADRLKAERPRRQVQTTIEPGLLAEGDPALLETVLNNLIENAWKFTGPRERAMIEFGGVPVEGHTAFFVRDNGVGFDVGFSQKLFGAFQRMHKRSEFPGTGVGLASVQRIVHRHGGRVWAEAEVDRGATFYFTLEPGA